MRAASRPTIAIVMYRMVAGVMQRTAVRPEEKFEDVISKNRRALYITFVAVDRPVSRDESVQH
jgi:hypothetical protein